MRISDWSSDMCSSDLREMHVRVYPFLMPTIRFIPAAKVLFTVFEVPIDDTNTATFIVIHGDAPANRPHLRKILGLDDARFWSEERSDERRVGKECVSTCRSRWAPYH